ncbi:hypothetical protein MHYP_G00318290 [Metynnis hypsauchen]
MSALALGGGGRYNGRGTLCQMFESVLRDKTPSKSHSSQDPEPVLWNTTNLIEDNQRELGITHLKLKGNPALISIPAARAQHALAVSGHNKAIILTQDAAHAGGQACGHCGI